VKAAVCVRLCQKKYLLKPQNKIQNLYVRVYAAAAAAAVINITEFNLRTVLILQVVWSM